MKFSSIRVLDTSLLTNIWRYGEPQEHNFGDELFFRQRVNQSKLLSVKGPPCCLQMYIVCNNLRFFFLFSSSFLARTSFFDIFTVAKKSLSSFLTSELSLEVLAYFQLSNLSLSLKLLNDKSTRSALVQITLFLDIDWTDSVPMLIFT